MRRVHDPAGFRYFTLIELLIVIAIIAILAAMLLPALNQARAKAHASSCTARLKQMGGAFQSYSDSNDGWLPYKGTQYYETYLMGQYLGASISQNGSYTATNPTFYRCPGDAKPMEARQDSLDKIWTKVGEPDLWEWLALSYGANERIFGSNDRDEYYMPHKLNRIKYASQALAVGDACNRGISRQDHIEFRHNSRANLVFIDGHVNNYQKEELPDYNDAQVFYYGVDGKYDTIFW